MASGVIEELVAEPEAPADPRRVPRVHDFRLPKSLDRTRIRSLRVLYEGLAHRASGPLTTRLRTPVTLSLGELEQHSWGDYAATLPEPTCLFTTTLAPLPGRVVLHIPIELAMTVVDLRMGGRGRPATFEEGRAPTEIEQRLLSDIAEAVFAELPNVFAPLASLQIGSVTQVASVQYLPPVRSTDMELLIPLVFQLHDESRYSFELCFPFTMVQPLVESLDVHSGEDQTPGSDSHAVLAGLLGTHVDLRVRFPLTGLTPAEILHLAVGDVVSLPYDGGAPLSLTVGDVHFAQVLPTTSGKRLACVVIDSPEETP